MPQYLNAHLNEVLNKLTKWRSVFAGWQLGTRSDEDPECQAVKDHRELIILLRAEMNALTVLLIQKGVFTIHEWETQLITEAQLLDQSYERKFPGFKSTPIGISIDIEKAKETMKNWKP